MKEGRKPSLEDVFPGSSDMARRMRAFDWSSTALGDPLDWPDGLKIPLRMLLTSRFEMWLGWGDDLLFFYNDSYVPTLGTKHPSMLGKPFREVWAEVYADVADQVDLVSSGEATWNKALLLLLERNGYPEETYHSFSYSPLYGDDAKVQGLLCVVTEETERVIGERRLETVRTLGTKLVGAEDRLSVKEAVRSTFDANRKDFPFALVYLEGDDDFACTPDAACLLGGNKDVECATEPRVFELRDASDLPAGAWAIPPDEAICLPIPGPGGREAVGRLILGLNPHRRNDPAIPDFGSLLAGQISGALANVETLATERRRADRVWAQSRDLLIVADKHGTFKSVSPAWTRILGHPTEDVVGRNFRDFVVEEDVAPTSDALAEATRSTDVSGFVNRYRTLDGGVRWLSWRTANEEDVVYAYGRDVTEEKANAEALAAAEEAMRQSQKMEAVGQLTGGIAHDFNNLLTVIRSSVDFLRRPNLADERRARYLDAVSDTVDRAAKLTGQLLAFARRQALSPEVFEVGEYVARIAELVDTLTGPEIRVVIVASDGPCHVRADLSQFETALINIAVNARDAMKDGGTLTLSVEAPVPLPDIRGHAGSSDPFISVAIDDTGSGIEAHILGRIFEPFYTTKDVGKGTGLGLSQVYGFAKQSGGDVDVASSVGEGSRFTMYLPQVPAPVRRSPEPASEEPVPEGDGRHVIVVEDNIEVGGFARQILEELGYVATWVQNGEAALRAIRGGVEVDVVFSDVVMPGMGGVELAQELRRTRPNLPVVLTSGYSHVLAEEGDHGFRLLHKPYSVDQLSRVLREATRQPSTIRPDETV